MSTRVFIRAAYLGCTAIVLAGGTARSQEPLSGRHLYMNNCAACHGAFGEGDGPVAAAMRVTVPNLRTLQARNRGIFPLDAVTAYVDGREIPSAHGDRNMPVWGDAFGIGDDSTLSERVAQARIEAVVEFLMELQYRE